jgi:fatty-acyl-CoA synthase
VTSGYWKQPGIAPFTPDGWLETGDAATVDDDEYVFIRGRVQHPAVAECAVIGVPDEKWGDAGRAVVVPRTATGKVIKARLQERYGATA